VPLFLVVVLSVVGPKCGPPNVVWWRVFHRVFVETQEWSATCLIFVEAQGWPATYCGIWRSTEPVHILCVSFCEYHVAATTAVRVSGYMWYGDDSPHLS